MGGRRSGYRLWVGKPEGKRPLGRHRPRWEDNITMDHHEMVWGYGRFRAGSVLGLGDIMCGCGIGSSGSIKCGNILTT